MTGFEIVKRAKMCKGHAYWYGGKGQKATRELADVLKKNNPSVWTNSYYGKAMDDVANERIVMDCSGLVSFAYALKPYLGSWEFRDKFHLYLGSKKLPGMIAWKPGHVAIISDSDGHIIEMRGIDYDYCDYRTVESMGATEILYEPTVSYDVFENRSGWEFEDNWRYWKNGKLIKERWEIINNHWWYFDRKGIALMGIQEINNQIYYIDEYLGCLRTDQYGALREWKVERNSDGTWQTITT